MGFYFKGGKKATYITNITIEVYQIRGSDEVLTLNRVKCPSRTDAF